MKTAFLVIGSLALVVGGLYLYMKQPKVVIDINDTTGEGTATMAGKSGKFDKASDVLINTWNGYRLTIGGSSTKGASIAYSFTRNGNNIESSTNITPYDNGSSYVAINHTK